MQNQKKERLFSRIWQGIRNLLGFYKSEEQIESRLRDADLRSLQCLTVVAAGIEIWMLIRYTVRYGSLCDSIGEFLQYTYGYWILLLLSVALLTVTTLYFRGRFQKIGRYGHLLCLLFFCTGIYFGITTSMSDFSRGRMIICFLTMLMYGTVIVIKRPFISLLLTLIPSSLFLWLLNHNSFDRSGAQMVLSSGDTINFITFIIIIIILEVSVYFQRYREAREAYELDKAAITDDLTGIHNFHKFEIDADVYMKDSIARGKHPLYLLIDLKNFQTFNEHFRYSGGDQILRQMGQMVREAFPDEPAARKAIDDFVVLTNRDDYLDRLSEIRAKIRSDYPAESYLDIRVGSYRAVDETRSPRRCIDHADYALKRLQGSDSEFILEYDSSMEKEFELKQYVLNNLDTAIREGYIKVYYQPVVWSKTGTLSGAEALVRWIDPEKGFMNPGVFIPTLEEGRQIHKLDLCVYETVCRQIRRCLDEGLPVLPTSLNFSRLDFELMDAVGELEKLVQRYQVPREYLHVEVTESAATKDVKGLQEAIARLHGLGYTVWLDDFGSGYSSMNFLKDFDFDVLKIDMEFLRNFHENRNSRKIISQVIQLAEVLDMHTLCEGVETEEAIEFLKESGCEQLQGYYYSKPVPYDELLKKIQDGTLRLSTE